MLHRLAVGVELGRDVAEVEGHLAEEDGEGGGERDDERVLLPRCDGQRSDGPHHQRRHPVRDEGKQRLGS